MSLLKEISHMGAIQQRLKNSDASDAGTTDIENSAGASKDIKFMATRNKINTDGEITGAGVASYLNRAAELNDEVDTVPFGLETDDGEIVKVYVNAQQADEFETAMKNLLGLEDDIEEAIEKLSKEFDIVDVIWPDDADDDDSDEFADLDLDDPLSRDIEDDPDKSDDSETTVIIDEPDEDSSNKEDSSSEEDSSGEDEIRKAADEDSPDEETESDGETPDEDEEKEDEELDGETSKDEKDKKPAKKKPSKTLTPEGEEMNRYRNLLQSLINEATETGLDEDSVKDGLNIPLDGQQKALLSKMKKQLEKKIVYFFVMTGIPGRYLNTAEVEDGIKGAADVLRKQVTIRRHFERLYSGLGAAKGFAIQPAATVEEAKTKRGGIIQKMLEAIMVELGFPESLILTTGPATIGQFLLKTAKIIEQDTDLEQTLRQLALRMGIKTGDLLGESIDAGSDEFIQAVVSLIADLGIPDSILQQRRAAVIKALREKKMSIGNRAEVIRKIGILQVALNKNAGGAEE